MTAPFLRRFPLGVEDNKVRRERSLRGASRGGRTVGCVERGAGPAVRLVGGRRLSRGCGHADSARCHGIFLRGRAAQRAPGFDASEQTQEHIPDGLDAVLASNVCVAHRRPWERFAAAAACTVGSGICEALAILGCGLAELQVACQLCAWVLDLRFRLFLLLGEEAAGRSDETRGTGETFADGHLDCALRVRLCELDDYSDIIDDMGRCFVAQGSRKAICDDLVTAADRLHGGLSSQRP